MGCRGRGLGPFPCRHVIAAPCFWQWRHPQLVAVKSCDGKLCKVDGEPTVVLGQQAHALAPEHFAQKHVVLLPTKVTMRPHTAAPACSPGNRVPASAPETGAPTADRRDEGEMAGEKSKRAAFKSEGCGTGKCNPELRACLDGAGLTVDFSAMS